MEDTRVGVVGALVRIPRGGSRTAPANFHTPKILARKALGLQSESLPTAIAKLSSPIGLAECSCSFGPISMERSAVSTRVLLYYEESICAPDCVSQEWASSSNPGSRSSTTHSARAIATFATHGGMALSILRFLRSEPYRTRQARYALAIAGSTVQAGYVAH